MGTGQSQKSRASSGLLTRLYAYIAGLPLRSAVGIVLYGLCMWLVARSCSRLSAMVAHSCVGVQASEQHIDGAESQPQHSTGEFNPVVNPSAHWAETTESSKQGPRPSVSSTSATGLGSSNPAQESEAASAPPANEQDSSRPTDDQIIAQENEIRCNAAAMYAVCSAAW